MDHQAVVYGDARDTALPAAPDKRVDPEEVRVLVLLTTTSRALALVRWAYRLAHVSEGKFYCAYMRTPDAMYDRSGEHDLRDALELAREMGGQMFELAGDNLSDPILRFARRKQITHLVVGKPRHAPLTRFTEATLPEDLVNNIDGLHVVVLAEPPTDHR